MRDYFKALKFVLLIVIAAFIGTTFLVWGKGSITGERSGTPWAAQVNGEEIAIPAYQRAYRANYEFYRQRFGEQFNEEMAQRLRLREVVLNDLVQGVLILQRAKQEHLVVTDEELRQRIQSFPAFQQGGQFSRERYLALLAQNRLDAPTFEAEQRKDLLRRKIENLVRAGVQVSEGEAKQAFVARNTRVKAAHILVQFEPLAKAAQVTDQERTRYYEERKAQFQRPERRRAQIALVSQGRVAAKVVVTDKEIEEFYKANPKEYEKPKRVRVAHILAQVPPTGGTEAEEKAKAKAKLDAALNRIKAGEDFAKVAKDVSEDKATAPDGGDLGLVGPGELVAPFEQVAFGLKVGEVHHEPVRTQFGYHLIKVLEIREGTKRALRDVRDQIKRKLAEDRADEQALAKAEEAQKVLRGAKDFAAEAQKLDMEVKDTGLVARGDPLAGVGRSKEVEEALFGLAVGGTSSAIKAPDGYAVVRVVEKKEAYVPPLEEVSADVTTAVKRQKAEQQAQEKARLIAQALLKGEDPATVAKREGAGFGDTGFFSRSAPMGDGALAQVIGGPALELRVGGVSDPLKGRDGFYVLKGLERREPDPTRFKQERGEVVQGLLGEKRDRVWQGWLASLREGAKIEVNQSLVGGLE